MKIKVILVESFKSPFFNLLAIGNLVLVSITFADVYLTSTPLTRLTIALNLPAFLLSRILAGPIYQTFALVPPLIYLQWIFIGAFAKFVASRMRPTADYASTLRP